MKSNHGKCHLLLCTPDESDIQVFVTTTGSFGSKKLLSVHFDNKLKFDSILNYMQKG